VLGYLVSTEKAPTNSTLSFAIEGDGRKPWTSRSSINQGVSPSSLSHSIEYDFARFPDVFSVLIWGLERPESEDEFRILNRLNTRLKYRSLSATNKIEEGALTFHTVNECTIMHSKTPLVENMLFPTDFHNFMDNSWPSDSPIRFQSETILLVDSDKEIYVDQPAIFFGSSTSWFHFLIEVFPRFLRFGTENIDALVPVIEHNVPSQILEVVRCVTQHEPIMLHPFERARFSEITLCIEARYPNGLDLLNRQQDILLVRGFFADKFRLHDAQVGRRIFLVRNSKLFRHSIELNKLWELLTIQGFEIIDSGDLSMVEQISIFSGASVVIGETGSSLTNLIFCPTGCRVIELNLHSFMPGFFSEFCAVLNFRHWPVDEIYIKQGVIKVISRGIESNLSALTDPP
jgi:hypothetical protein